MKSERKLENKDHSDLTLLVCLVLVQMHFCVKYEETVINHKGMRGRYRKTENNCHFKNMGHIDLIFHVHILRPFIMKCANIKFQIKKSDLMNLIKIGEFHQNK